MSVGPISLQNLFLRSDQISKELAHNAEAGSLQQDKASEKITQKNYEESERIHKVEEDADNTIVQVGDEHSNSPSKDNTARQSADDAPPHSTEIVSEEYIGNTIDISK